MENFKEFKIRDLSLRPLYINDISWNYDGLKVTLESESA